MRNTRRVDRIKKLKGGGRRIKFACLKERSKRSREKEGLFSSAVKARVGPGNTLKFMTRLESSNPALI